MNSASLTNFRSIPSNCNYASTRTLLPQRKCLRQSSSGVHNQEPQAISMQITRHNFTQILPELQTSLQQCQFYSFDCEMTGIFLEDFRDEYFDDFNQRYKKLSSAAQQFLVSQFGLSLFIWNNAGYQVKTFNFYVFPRPFSGFDKRFLCQASSIQFLATQSFDFNKFIYEGIQYLPLSVRDKKLKTLESLLVQTDAKELTKSEIRMIAELRHDLNAWLKGDEIQLVLGPSSPQTRILQQQIIQKEYLQLYRNPSFTVEAQSVDADVILVLTKITVGSTTPSVSGVIDVDIQEVHKATGFSAVLEMLKDSNKPAVGHNSLFDLAFVLEQFVGPLPRDWVGYKAMVSKWFPGGVYDTKYLGSKLPNIFPHTGLQSMYQALSDDTMGGNIKSHLRQRTNRGFPAISHAPGYTDYEACNPNQKGHEAGYDAFMTGVVFARLLSLFEAPNSISDGISAASTPNCFPDLASVSSFCWHQFLGGSVLPYTNLAGEDPAPASPNAFHLLTKQPLKYSDINSKLKDAGFGRVKVSVKGCDILMECGPTQAAGAVSKLKQCAWCIQVQKLEDFYIAKQASANDTTERSGARGPQRQRNNGPRRQAPPVVSEAKQAPVPLPEPLLSVYTPSDSRQLDVIPPMGINLQQQSAAGALELTEVDESSTGQLSSLTAPEDIELTMQCATAVEVSGLLQHSVPAGIDSAELAQQSATAAEIFKQATHSTSHERVGTATPELSTEPSGPCRGDEASEARASPQAVTTLLEPGQPSALEASSTSVIPEYSIHNQRDLSQLPPTFSSSIDAGQGMEPSGSGPAGEQVVLGSEGQNTAAMAATGTAGLSSSRDYDGSSISSDYGSSSDSNYGSSSQEVVACESATLGGSAGASVLESPQTLIAGSIIGRNESISKDQDQHDARTVHASNGIGARNGIELSKDEHIASNSPGHEAAAQINGLRQPVDENVESSSSISKDLRDDNGNGECKDESNAGTSTKSGGLGDGENNQLCKDEISTSKSVSRANGNERPQSLDAQDLTTKTPSKADTRVDEKLRQNGFVLPKTLPIPTLLSKKPLMPLVKPKPVILPSPRT